MNDRESYKPQFEVGKTYLTLEGKKVKIIAENNQYGPHYRHVQGDDGETIVEEAIGCPGVYEITYAHERGWRYDRSGDVGRCTGSAVDNPRNLLPGSVEE